jgi:formamidopyrimidine-DNA glycosylase
MPELPELEVIREVLERRIVAQEIAAVTMIPPCGAVVVRDLTHTGFEKTLVRQTIQSIDRRGKFLIFSFQQDDTPLFLVINPKLTGRLRLSDPAEKRHKKTCIVFDLASGIQLRYIDQKQMGQVYLVHKLADVPGFASLGPEPLDISLETFRQRLKPFRGEIKGVLTRGEFVAGIGNAYADEILWEARLHPYRKRTQLIPEEVERLYRAVRTTLLNAVEKVREGMQENIDQEPRQFMAVHMKTDLPCPRCGSPISLVSANQRITNFCRTCQPGGLIKGMD